MRLVRILFATHAVDKIKTCPNEDFVQKDIWNVLVGDEIRIQGVIMSGESVKRQKCVSNSVVVKRVTK